MARGLEENGTHISQRNSAQPNLSGEDQSRRPPGLQAEPVLRAGLNDPSILDGLPVIFALPFFEIPHLVLTFASH